MATPEGGPVIYDELAEKHGTPHQPPDVTYAIPAVEPQPPAFPAPTATRYEPEPASPVCCCAQLLARLDELEALIRGGARA
jgi:hypothetical protein